MGQNKIKITKKQERAFANIIKNGGNVSKAMIEAGYSKNTAKTPQKLTEREGYKALLAEHGLTPSLVAVSLKDDIQGKPQNRKGELELAAKMLGMLRDKLELSGSIGLLNAKEIERLHRIRKDQGLLV